jgi:lycopene elongase/hydratase (dihydrobisanhydrobacterioruberin-forming)
MSWFDILKLSRPRFWLYIAGPYCIGSFAAGGLDLIAQPLFYAILAYFLLPANILLYGINDVNDYETDQLNAKKGDQEFKTKISDLKIIYAVCLSIVLISFILIFVLKSLAFVWLTIFLVLSVAYSASPIRFKTIPFLDFTSNALYVVPALVGFTQFGVGVISIPLVLAACFWAFAMHLFSAIPDIKADIKSQTTTTATIIGGHNSLLLCFTFWLITALVTYAHNSMLFGAFLYPILGLACLYKKIDVEVLYWKFPLINSLAGFLLFVYTVLNTLSK